MGPADPLDFLPTIFAKADAMLFLFPALLSPSAASSATPQTKTQHAERGPSVFVRKTLLWIMVVAAEAVLTYALIDVDINLDVIVLGNSPEACARTRILHL